MVHNNCPPKSIVNNQTWNHGLQADVRGKQYQQHQVMRHEQTALIHALFRRYCYYAVTYVRIAANAIDVHGCVLFNHQRHCVQDYVHSQLITLGCKRWVCYSNSLSLFVRPFIWHNSMLRQNGRTRAYYQASSTTC